MWAALTLVAAGSMTVGMALGHHLNAMQVAYNYGGMAVGAGAGLLFLVLRGRTIR
jgi:hypothetical protein